MPLSLSGFELFIVPVMVVMVIKYVSLIFRIVGSIAILSFLIIISWKMIFSESSSLSIPTSLLEFAYIITLSVFSTLSQFNLMSSYLQILCPLKSKIPRVPLSLPTIYLLS